MVRIEGLYTILKGKGEEGEGRLKENMTFMKANWALRRIDGRYNSFMIMSVQAGDSSL